MSLPRTGALALRANRFAPSAMRAARPGVLQARNASNFSNDPSVTDPGMNGGYVNPVPVKRSLRDPYGDWWDKQERRNFGEAVHEDNDILGVFSTESYRHATVGRAGFHFLCFVAVSGGLIATVYQFSPDKPTIPRSFPGGLEAELGGPSSKRAIAHGEELENAKIRE